MPRRPAGVRRAGEPRRRRRSAPPPWLRGRRDQPGTGSPRDTWRRRSRAGAGRRPDRRGGPGPRRCAAAIVRAQASVSAASARAKVVLGDAAGAEVVVLDGDRLEPRRPRPQEGGVAARRPRAPQALVVLGQPAALPVVDGGLPTLHGHEVEPAAEEGVRSLPRDAPHPRRRSRGRARCPRCGPGARPNGSATHGRARWPHARAPPSSPPAVPFHSGVPAPGPGADRVAVASPSSAPRGRTSRRARGPPTRGAVATGRPPAAAASGHTQTGTRPGTGPRPRGGTGSRAAAARPWSRRRSGS